MEEPYPENTIQQNLDVGAAELQRLELAPAQAEACAEFEIDHETNTMVINPEGPDPLQMKGRPIELPEDLDNMTFAYGGQPVLINQGVDAVAPIAGFSMPGVGGFNILQRLGFSTEDLLSGALAQVPEDFKPEQLHRFLLQKASESGSQYGSTMQCQTHPSSPRFVNSPRGPHRYLSHQYVEEGLDTQIEPEQPVIQQSQMHVQQRAEFEQPRCRNASPQPARKTSIKKREHQSPPLKDQYPQLGQWRSRLRAVNSEEDIGNASKARTREPSPEPELPGEVLRWRRREVSPASRPREMNPFPAERVRRASPVVRGSNECGSGGEPPKKNHLPRSNRFINRRPTDPASHLTQSSEGMHSSARYEYSEDYPFEIPHGRGGGACRTPGMEPVSPSELNLESELRSATGNQACGAGDILNVGNMASAAIQATADWLAGIAGSKNNPKASRFPESRSSTAKVRSRSRPPEEGYQSKPGRVLRDENGRPIISMHPESEDKVASARGAQISMRYVDSHLQQQSRAITPAPSSRRTMQGESIKTRSQTPVLRPVQPVGLPTEVHPRDVSPGTSIDQKIIGYHTSRAHADAIGSPREKRITAEHPGASTTYAAGIPSKNEYRISSKGHLVREGARRSETQVAYAPVGGADPQLARRRQATVTSEPQDDQQLLEHQKHLLQQRQNYLRNRQLREQQLVEEMQHQNQPESVDDARQMSRHQRVLAQQKALLQQAERARQAESEQATQLQIQQQQQQFQLQQQQLARLQELKQLQQQHQREQQLLEKQLQQQQQLQEQEQREREQIEQELQRQQIQIQQQQLHQLQQQQLQQRQARQPETMGEGGFRPEVEAAILARNNVARPQIEVAEDEMFTVPLSGQDTELQLPTLTNVDAENDIVLPSIPTKVKAAEVMHPQIAGIGPDGKIHLKLEGLAKQLDLGQQLNFIQQMPATEAEAHRRTEEAVRKAAEAGGQGPWAQPVTNAEALQHAKEEAMAQRNLIVQQQAEHTDQSLGAEGLVVGEEDSVMRLREATKIRTFEIEQGDGTSRTLELVVVCEQPRIELIRDFLSSQEIIDIDNLLDGVVAVPHEPNNLLANTSMDDSAKGLILKILQRMSALTDLDTQNFAGLCPSVITQSATESTKEFASLIRLYLDDPVEGTTSEFPYLGLTLRPKCGSALRWDCKNAKGFKAIRASHEEVIAPGAQRKLLTAYIRNVNLEPTEAVAPQ